LLFSLGTAISGSTFLALIYDVSPEHQRGRSVGIVWTFLLLGFTVGGVLFGVLLPEHKQGQAITFTAQTVLVMFTVGSVLMGLLWAFAIWGEERRGAPIKTHAPQEHSTSIRADLALVWQDRNLAAFLGFLSLSMLFAFSQDLILEPFAADVFNMSPSVTARFAAYWGTMAILGTILFLLLSRRFRWLTNHRMSLLGVVMLVVAFAMFGVAGLANVRWLVTPGLIVLGAGLGVWNVGALGLMMDMSPAGRAGTFLGFWTLVVTVARGTGVAMSGPLRDIGLAITGNYGIAYGAVFVLGAVGLVVSLVMLLLVRQAPFKATSDTASPDHASDKILTAAMD
jgi:MFS transporter, BCD family, chlorophyll transporter